MSDTLADCSDAQVLVLLSTFNGEQWLEQQLDSILKQDFRHWSILARDDGSSDRSAAILRSYADAHPEKLSILEQPEENLGAAGSFSCLMEAACEMPPENNPKTPLYYALADQDDVWCPTKLSCLVDRMVKEESVQSPRPILIHSDLRVVDEACAEIAASFIEYQGLDVTRCSFAAQLTVNTVTGCTLLANRALLDMALPVPAEAMMHDWWLSLVTSQFGSIYYIDSPLVEYRQHGANSLGAKQYHPRGFNLDTLKRFLAYRKSAESQQAFTAVAKQAAAFNQRYGHLISGRGRQAMELCIALPDKSLWGQRLALRRLRLYR